MHHASFSLQPASQPLREQELARAIALAIASAASGNTAFKDVRRFCRSLETSVLASDAGPLGWSLLESLDGRLREALGDHDLLDGRYA